MYYYKLSCSQYKRHVLVQDVLFLTKVQDRILSVQASLYWYMLSCSQYKRHVLVQAVLFLTEIQDKNILSTSQLSTSQLVLVQAVMFSVQEACSGTSYLVLGQKQRTAALVCQGCGRARGFRYMTFACLCSGNPPGHTPGH